MVAPRRILFVSGYFPPLAPMGAVRSGKLAEHWKRAGHDVRTVAIALTPDGGAQLQQPARSTFYIPYREPGQFVSNVKSLIRRSPIVRLLFDRKTGLDQIGSSQPKPADLEALTKLGWIDFYYQ